MFSGRPEGPRSVVPVNKNDSSIDIYYARPKNPIDYYVISAIPARGSVPPFVKNTSSIPVEFGNLVPGEQYNITVTGTLKGVDTLPAFRLHERRKFIFKPMIDKSSHNELCTVLLPL